MPLSIRFPSATRRHALALGLAALPGLRHAPTAEGKKRDSCKKKSLKKVEETCGRQFAPCVTAASPVCIRAADPEVCQEKVRECCGFMGQCDVDGYLACSAALVDPI